MSKTFEERLRTESVGWVEAGLIDSAQREVLLTRHPEPAHAGGGRFIGILGLVGGVLVLAGVCLLIGSNWQRIGDWTKIIALVVFLAGAYFTGWRMKISPGRHPLIGDAFFMLGAGLFIGGIALVSQIFHLNARPATGVLVWWLGIVAVPWLVSSKGAQFVSLAAFVTWFGMELFTEGSWLVMSTAGWDEESLMMFFAVMTGLGVWVWLFGLALRGGRFEAFADMHEKWGAFIACGGLYVLGFYRHAYDWSADGINAAPLGVVAVGLAAFGWWAWRSSRRECVMLLPWWILSLAVAAVCYMSFALGDEGWLWSGLAWGGLFMLNLFMIRAGLATGREGWVNLAIGFIALNIITRYFDLFGTMMQGGLFFVVTGVIIIALGIWLERKRRTLLHALRAGKEGMIHE